MGYVEDAEPLIKYHDLDGPLQDQFYRCLGEFLTCYTGAEEDIVLSVRGVMASSCGDSKSSYSVIHILTAAAPVGAMMDLAAIVAEEVLGFTPDELDRLKKAKSRFDQHKSLRNLLAHQPAMMNPYTETPFGLQIQTGETRAKNFKTIYIGVEALEAAIHDAPLAGYHYRLALARSEPLEAAEPTWRYTPALLDHRHHQKR